MGDVQMTDFLIGIDVQAELVQQFLRILDDLTAVVTPELVRGKIAAEDIFRDGQRSKQLPLLVDDADPATDRVYGALKMNFFPVDQDLPDIRLDIGAQDLQKRGLAGAVFSHQGHDAAAFRLEVDPVQRSDSRVVLFNIPELQRFLHVFLSPTHHSAFSDIYRHTFKNVR